MIFKWKYPFEVFRTQKSGLKNVSLYVVVTVWTPGQRISYWNYELQLSMKLPEWIMTNLYEKLND